MSNSDILEGAVGTIASLAPIPALVFGVEIVKSIVEACMMVQTNKEEARHLGHRCGEFAKLFEDKTSQLPGEQGEKARKAALYTLKSIDEKIRQWPTDFLKAFMKRDVIKDDIKKFHQELNDCCMKFDISMTMQFAQWQDTFEQRYVQDSSRMFELINTISKQSTSSGEKIDELQQMMSATHISTDETLRAVQDLSVQMKGMTLDREWMRVLQQTLKIVPDTGLQYHHRTNNLVTNLWETSHRSGQLPPEIDLQDDEVRKLGTKAISGSAYFDIWDGLWLDRDRVTIKIFRNMVVSPETRKRFRREADIWRRVGEKDGGQYILPFIGLWSDGQYPGMVSLKPEYGNIMTFLRENRGADRYLIIRSIAAALNVLHSQNIAHGDIRPANIYVHASPVGDYRVLLAEFGMAHVIEDVTGVTLSTTAGSQRYIAPELCDEKAELNIGSDIFAFAMTVYEIMTGEAPFAHMKNGNFVIVQIVRGIRPPRPLKALIDDKLWNVIERCWAGSVADRPKIAEVLTMLQ